MRTNPRQNPTGKRRLLSPDRFVAQQLAAAGQGEFLRQEDLFEEPDARIEAEENVDIELKNQLPLFLRSGETEQTQSTAIEGPQFLVQPHGSMAQTISRSRELASKRQANKSQSGFAGSDLPAPHKESIEKDDVLPSPRGNAQKQLPVELYKQQILDVVAKNRVVIIQGDTGSGKTTKITQYLHAEYPGIVACTQPRRVAAISIAKRVAGEMSTELGRLVGYNVRFDNMSGSDTKIKYMTDGMLQRDILADPLLRGYSVVVLDEAHERTVATDVLFALLKKTLSLRSDLKIVVTSATIDAEKFSEYFDHCPVLKIPGRSYPVEIFYEQTPQLDYFDSALTKVMSIHMSQEPGDILVFMTGQEEIDACCRTLAERAHELDAILDVKLLILPVYSALPSDVQARIFEPTPAGFRKVVFATNIAETSITIDGIRYVVDPGLVKVNIHDPRTGMELLKVVPISKQQAAQRAGRAGRTAPGKCYRLYTASAFENEMLETAVPEIQRQSMSMTVLLLKAMGIDDVLGFEFLDKPSAQSIISACQDLFLLGALNDDGSISKLGKTLAQFPMNPEMAKVLLESVEKNCASEVLTIIAMLDSPNVFVRPKTPKEQKIAESKKHQLADSSGDHLTLLNVFQLWTRKRQSFKWCVQHYVNSKSLQRAVHVRQQLEGILKRLRLKITSSSDKEAVLRVLCCGFFKNVARQGGNGFKTIINQTEVSIHPSSVLFGKKPSYVLYDTLLITSKEYMSCVSIIRPAWLLEYAPRFYQELRDKRNLKESVQPLFSKRSRHSDDWRISSQKKHVKFESKRF